MIMKIELLVEYKKQNKLSYSDIAKLSGLTQPTVWRTLNKKSIPNIETLTRLVSITNGKLTIMDILSG